MGDDDREIGERLAEPFDPREVKFKPQMVKNNRCLAMAYIDSRLIMDRLDQVVGPGRWKDEYQVLPDGSVLCRLAVYFGPDWVAKEDVGSPSEQPDLGDRMKAAFSDALKRAAVKFGVGRYLYRLPAVWVDYDPAKKQIVSPPQLPAFALPGGRSAARAAPAAPKAPPPAKAEAPAEAQAGLPTDGVELLRRLAGYEQKLVQLGACPNGALLAHVKAAGVRAGYSATIVDWSGPAIQLAVDAVKEFDNVRLKK